jgi:hypothetical protein
MDEMTRETERRIEDLERQAIAGIEESARLRWEATRGIDHDEDWIVRAATPEDEATAEEIAQAMEALRTRALSLPGPVFEVWSTTLGAAERILREWAPAPRA